MSLMQRIRDYYGVPAELDRRVKFGGHFATVTGAPEDGGMYLSIRLDGDSLDLRVHPTWRMDYLDGNGER